jgi:ribosomal protein L37AE/L43A
MKVIVWKCDRCGDVKERTPKKRDPLKKSTVEERHTSWVQKQPEPRRRRFSPTLPTNWTTFEHGEKSAHLCEGCSTSLTDWMKGDEK